MFYIGMKQQSLIGQFRMTRVKAKERKVKRIREPTQGGLIFEPSALALKFFGKSALGEHASIIRIRKLPKLGNRSEKMEQSAV